MDDPVGLKRAKPINRIYDIPMRGDLLFLRQFIREQRDQARQQGDLTAVDLLINTLGIIERGLARVWPGGPLLWETRHNDRAAP